MRFCLALGVGVVHTCIISSPHLSYIPRPHLTVRPHHPTVHASCVFSMKRGRPREDAAPHVEAAAERAGTSKLQSPAAKRRGRAGAVASKPQAPAAKGRGRAGAVASKPRAPAAKGRGRAGASKPQAPAAKRRGRAGAAASKPQAPSVGAGARTSAGANKPQAPGATRSAGAGASTAGMQGRMYCQNLASCMQGRIKVNICVHGRIWNLLMHAMQDPGRVGGRLAPLDPGRVRASRPSRGSE